MRLPTPSSPTGTPHPRRAVERPSAAGLDLPPQHLRLIENSHQRCVALGVSRIDRPDHAPLGRPDLQLARERNRRLFDHAAPVMEMLYEQIVNSQSMVVLTDATGTVLHALGDDDFLGRARQVALAPGTNWSEAAKGTNAVGTALIEEHAVLVHADEHFLHANHFLTCSAAPILDPRGNVLGVLDVSGDRGSYHPHTMALVTMSARMIENRWLTDDPRHLLRLHFHRHADFIGTLKEGIVAVGADGRVVGANRSALEQLGLGAAALRQHTLPSLFGVDVGALVDRCRAASAVPVPVHDLQGRRLYLLARTEVSAWSGPVTAPQSADAALAPAPAARRSLPAPAAGGRALAALCTGDPQIEQAIGRIRRVLGRGIPILLLGETGTGKEGLARAIHADAAPGGAAFVVLRPAAHGEAALAAALQQASGGSLFVDEPGEWPAAQQRLLVQLLQQRHTQPVDRAGPAPGPAVLLCASRDDPRGLVDRGLLREDLLQQFDGLPVRLPALRERADLAVLAQAIVAQQADAPPLSDEVLQLLGRHPWPGNLRQLHNVLRTAAALASGATAIGTQHLPDGFVEAALPRPRPAAPDLAAVRPLGDLQIEAIYQALAACEGNITRASRRLGISRNTIYRRLRDAT